MKQHFLALSIVFFLGACTTSGTIVNYNGQPEGEMKWPEASDTQLDHKTGLFPNLRDLNNVRSGMSRDQLYQLIGRPHYSEGFRVREWNYLFHFNTPKIDKNNIISCQYKVLFDKKLRSQSYFWRPIEPKNATCPPTEAKNKIETFTLATDALFPFDLADLKDIKPRGRGKLDEFVKNILARSSNVSLSIRGHTDFFGSEAYNIKLSQQRAASVAQYLTNIGINAKSIIETTGLGESNPVKTDCPSNLRREKMINCVAPNRRVEIDTW